MQSQNIACLHKLTKTQQSQFDRLAVHQSVIVDACSKCHTLRKLPRVCKHDVDPGTAEVESLSLNFKNSGRAFECDKQAARKAADVSRRGGQEHPVLRTTQVPSDEYPLSSSHLSSGKQTTSSESSQYQTYATRTAQTPRPMTCCPMWSTSPFMIYLRLNLHLLTLTSLGQPHGRGVY